MNATKVNAGPAESNGRLLLGIWRDSLHVTCGLTACTPGSAQGPTLGNEYGKTLPFYWSSLLVPGRFEKDESTAIDVAEARRHSQYGQHGNQSRTGELRRRPGRQRVFIARRYRPWRRRRPTVSAFPRLPCFLSSLTISSHFSSRSAFSGPFLSFISSLQFSSPSNFFSVKAQLANGSKCPSVCPSVCLSHDAVFTSIYTDKTTTEKIFS